MIHVIEIVSRDNERKKKLHFGKNHNIKQLAKIMSNYQNTTKCKETNSIQLHLTLKNNTKNMITIKERKDLTSL